MSFSVLSCTAFAMRFRVSICLTSMPLCHTLLVDYLRHKRASFSVYSLAGLSLTTPQSQLLSGGDESSPCLIVKERDTG